MSAAIAEDDFVASVADALQYIACFHPPDFVAALHHAYLREESPAARDALAQILRNSRLSAEGRRPMCQDTGIVTAFVKIGMQARWAGTTTLQALVDAGVRRAYLDPVNPLRASIVDDPAGARTSTRDNTPAVVHVEMVPGDRVEVTLAAKGGGSENKATLAVLTPAASIADWVVDAVPKMGAGWCPPGVLGIGVGGTAEKAAVLAKQALMEPLDMHELLARGASNAVERLRIEIYRRVNALGIGAQGLGGLTTVLDVKITDWPTHATSLPVAVIPNCAATRHIHFELDGSGPARFAPPRADQWPAVDWSPAADARRVDVNRLTKEQVRGFRSGERLLLSGRLLTARDAAHKRICALLEAGEPLPPGLDFRDRVVYYVGPVPPVQGEVIGPAGPTTATRMDRYAETMFARAGQLAMIGKAERGPAAVEVIKRHGGAYFTAVGGAAYLVARAIRASRLVAFPDLGMEAVYEFEVVDMPVTVAVDSQGDSIHVSGPQVWRSRIANIPVVEA